MPQSCISGRSKHSMEVHGFCFLKLKSQCTEPAAVSLHLFTRLKLCNLLHKPPASLPYGFQLHSSIAAAFLIHGCSTYSTPLPTGSVLQGTGLSQHITSQFHLLSLPRFLSIPSLRRTINMGVTFNRAARFLGDTATQRRQRGQLVYA